MKDQIYFMQTETPEYEANKRVSNNISKVCHVVSLRVVLKSGQFVLKLFCQVSKSIFLHAKHVFLCAFPQEAPSHAYGLPQ